MPELTPDMQLHLKASRSGDTETVKLVEEKWAAEASGRKEAFAAGIACCIIPFIVCCALVACVGYWAAWVDIKAESIKRGVAEYDNKTGNWHWKENR